MANCIERSFGTTVKTSVGSTANLDTTTMDSPDTNIGLYLREISQVPLLTPQEEVKLAAQIKRGNKKARK